MNNLYKLTRKMLINSLFLIKEKSNYKKNSSINNN